MTTEPRAYTAEEMRDMFLDHVRLMAAYWAGLPDVDKATGAPMTIKDRCEGVAFSILTAIDGSSMALPAFDLIPSPQEDDKRLCKRQGENWFEPVVINDTMLHELFYKKG